MTSRSRGEAGPIGEGTGAGGRKRIRKRRRPEIASLSYTREFYWRTT